MSKLYVPVILSKGGKEEKYLVKQMVELAIIGGEHNLHIERLAEEMRT